MGCQGKGQNWTDQEIPEESGKSWKKDRCKSGFRKRGLANGVSPFFFFLKMKRNKTEKNRRKRKKRKKSEENGRKRKNSKKGQNGNGRKQKRTGKKSEENGKNWKKSEAIPFRRPLLRNPEQRTNREGRVQTGNPPSFETLPFTGPLPVNRKALHLKF